jgi:hypothetical protein
MRDWNMYKNGLMKVFGGFLLAANLVGCSGVDASDDGDDRATIGELQQNIMRPGGWNGSAFAPITVGMSTTARDVTYEWTTTAYSNAGKYLVCRGTWFGTCLYGTQYGYVTAASTPSQIKAVGISRTNGKVYAWYDYFGTPKFSEGTSDNLGALQPFNVPNGATINQLVEADMSDNGFWYFWWDLGSGVMRYSTSSTATNGGSLSGGNVTYLQTATIVGMAFDGQVPAHINTFYSNGNGTSTPLNDSTDRFNIKD